MNRWEFMSELAKLLTGIPQEEREEALQYYESYFIDAGLENEAQIIEELGSPLKVAEMIRENLDNPNLHTGEFSEHGYSDPRFKEEHLPAQREEVIDRESTANNAERSDIWGNKWFKIGVFVLIAIVAIRLVIPFVTGVFSAVFGLLIAAVTVVASLVIVGISIIIAGVGLVIGGISTLVTALPLGLMLSGAGMIVIALGVLITAGAVKLCTFVYPAMWRGAVALCRKIFGRKDEGGVAV